MSSLPNPYTAASEVLWEDFPRKQFSEECFRALNLIDRNREYLESLPQANGEDERAAQALSDIAVASGRLERTLTDLEKADEQNKAKIEAVEEKLNDLKADLPLVYVTREDYIRVMNRVEDKLDQILYGGQAKGKEG